jgi:hypothetical protein
LGFNGRFIDRRVGIEGIYRWTKGDHFTQFGADSGDAVMQCPLQVNDAIDERMGGIGGTRASTSHLYLGVIQGGEQVCERTGAWKNIAADDHTSFGVF